MRRIGADEQLGGNMKENKAIDRPKPENVRKGSCPENAVTTRSGAMIGQTNQIPEVRWDRILHLREAIARGTYRIPAAEWADRLWVHLSAE